MNIVAADGDIRTNSASHKGTLAPSAWCPLGHYRRRLLSRSRTGTRGPVYFTVRRSQTMKNGYWIIDRSMQNTVNYEHKMTT